MWLYVPAIKQGRMKKLSSLWRGPYTILDKIGSLTYRVQLIGSAKILVVHRNRLKIYYGEPMNRTPRSTQKGSTPTRHRERQMYPTTPSPWISSLPPKPSYADMVTRRQGTSPAAGYTTSLNSGISYRILRPQRNRQPPDYYETLLLNEFCEDTNNWRGNL